MLFRGLAKQEQRPIGTDGEEESKESMLSLRHNHDEINILF